MLTDLDNASRKLGALKVIVGKFLLSYFSMMQVLELFLSKTGTFDPFSSLGKGRRVFSHAYPLFDNPVSLG